MNLEIVHYLENRKGYKALAEFAMKHAKADRITVIIRTRLKALSYSAFGGERP